MLKNFVGVLIQEKFKYEPTSAQKKLIAELSGFITSGIENQILLIKGYAGTGKTTIVSALVKSLNKLKLKSVLLAPTGRAAKVLAQYSENKAYTIHKKIYRQKSSVDGFGRFQLNKNLHTYTIFIVDEASMISNSTTDKSVFCSGRLLDDLIEYVFNNQKCKLILIGDTAQLPPVKLDISPALEKKILENYFMEVGEVFLTDVVRQSKNSGILSIATDLRNLIPEFNNKYPKLNLNGFDDVKRISGENLIEEISDAYGKYGMEETIVISRSNKRANQYNQGIRNSILWREEEISIGDLLMVVKNNYFWLPENEAIDFIANGDIVEIRRINKYHECYGYKFADVSIIFIDYPDIEIDIKIMLNAISIEGASLDYEEYKRFFMTVAEDYAELGAKNKIYQKVKENPFFNALQVKFAYAITCHKAQGGQWKAVFVDQGYFIDDMLNVEYIRWLYTAITRSTEKLYFVNFKNEFFEIEK